MTSLYDAVGFLAGRCDGAGVRDSAGFNRYDAGYGHRLADMPESEWSARDRYNAWKMLRKYAVQLEMGGYIYSQFPAEQNGLAQAEKMVGAIASGDFVVMFPYNPGLVAEVKGLPKRRFDGDNKRWIVAPVAENIAPLFAFTQAHPEFEVTQTVLDKMAEIDAASEPQPQAPAQPEGPKFDGTLSVDAKRISVTFNAVPGQEVRDWMKAIPGWKYADRVWSFPVEHALKVAGKFSNHEGSAFILEDASRDVDDAQKARTETQEKLHAAIDLDAPLPNGRTLYKHQKTGVLRMLDDHKLVLADDMGLGKSAVSLMVAKAWRKAFDYPCFVICPASLKDNWFKEAAMVGVPIEVYSWAKMPEVPERPFILIGDEAHYCQNSKSQRGKRFLELSTHENCKALIAATGTPMKNARPANLWPLLRAVGADFAMDKKAYERRYCAAGPTRFSAWDTSGAAHLDELHEKCKPFMLRRLKKDCLDLPGKVRTMRPAELTKESQAAYDEAFNKMRQDYLDRLRIAEENKKAITARYLVGEIETEEYQKLMEAELSSEGSELVMLTHLRRAMSIAKVETGIEIAEDILGEGRAVVIFTDFVESAQQIASALKGYGVELLTGDVTGKDKDAGVSKRQAMVDRFQAGKSRVFVSTIKAGGVGITLTAASDVILVDRPWVPGDAEQAEDRCFSAGTPVLTPKGWIPIENIKIGDYVISQSGNAAMVTDAWSRSSRKMMADIDVMGNGVISCTADHKWLTFDGEWTEANNIRPGTLLALPGLGVSDYAGIGMLQFPDDCRISDTFINSWGTEQRNGRLIKAPDSIVLDDESLFVFGYFVGDGFASNTPGKGRFISFSGNTGKKINSLSRCEKWCNERGMKVNKQIDGNRVEYRAYCGEWANWFKANFGHFAENKQLPEWALSLSREQSRCFLNGMLSSDGYKRKNQAEYCTCSYVLAAQVSLLMMRAGYRPTIRNVVKDEIDYNCWIVGFTYGQEQFAKVRSVTFRNPNKINERYETVYDITVEGEESFVVSTMVVHNCNRIGQSIMVNCQWIQAGEIDVKIDSILEQKQERIDAVMEGDRKTMRGTGGSVTKQAMQMMFGMFDDKQKGKKK